MAMARGLLGDVFIGTLTGLDRRRRLVVSPDYSHHKDRGERRVLLKRELWRAPSEFYLDGVQTRVICASFAMALSDSALCALWWIIRVDGGPIP